MRVLDDARGGVIGAAGRERHDHGDRDDRDRSAPTAAPVARRDRGEKRRRERACENHDTSPRLRPLIFVRQRPIELRTWLGYSPFSQASGKTATAKNCRSIARQFPLSYRAPAGFPLPSLPRLRGREGRGQGTRRQAIGSEINGHSALRLACRRAAGRADSFTGTVWQDPIIEAPAPARVRSGLVRFEPGARTHWHTHPLGQTLVRRLRRRPGADLGRQGARDQGPAT